MQSTIMSQISKIKQPVFDVGWLQQFMEAVILNINLWLVYPSLFTILGHLNPSIQRNKLLSAEVLTRGVKFEFSKISIFKVFNLQNRSVPAYLFSIF